jgi:hypothetical protein
MHQHDQGSVAAAFAIFAACQPNRDAGESFFSHEHGV